MNNILLAILISIVCLVGCKHNCARDSLPILDVESAIDNKRSFNLSEISNWIEFIPLNTDMDGMVGNIQKMVTSESRFYISDDVRNSVKIFDKTGKFISTIGIIGRGPNELPYIRDLTVDCRNDNIYMAGGQNIVGYDVNSRITAFSDSITSGQIAFRDNELIVLQGHDGKVSDGKRTLFEVFSPDLQYKREINVADKGTIEILMIGRSVIYPAQNIMFDNGNSLLIKEILNDTVFRYKNDMVPEPTYRLDMGRYFVPAEAFGQNPTVKWNDAYNNITDIYDGEKHVIVKSSRFWGGSFDLDYLVFHKDDPSAGFTAVGPNGETGLFVDGIKFTPMCIRDNRLVGYIQAFDIVDNAESITNPDFKILAANLKEDSNPIIVIAELKK